MNGRAFITDGIIVTPKGEVNTTLVINNGKIEENDYRGDIPEGAEVISAEGMYVAPGIIDVHMHGGGGFDFMDGTEEAFSKIADIHSSHGITSIMPSTVACGMESFDKLCDIYRNTAGKINNVNFLGLHLEGPYIAYEMKGAQNPRYVRSPSEYEVDYLMDKAGDIIKMCTAAPEIDGIEYMAREMRKKNITLSSGHSDAVFSQFEKAMDMGFSHITHLYSNTTTVRKINQVVVAGILEAAYYFDDIGIELIGDGKHVAKETLRMALKIKGADKINITTDAMRAAGTDVSESYLGEIKPENRVIVEDGVAKLPDRSFYAGSIATGDRMVKWLVNTCGVSVSDAFKMLSETPSRLAGVNEKKGSIEKGKDADIIFLDKNFDVKKVMVRGIIS